MSGERRRSLPVVVRKFFKRIVHVDLVKPDLKAADIALDRWSPEDPPNVFLRGGAFDERFQSPLLYVFRPNRVNIDRSKGHPALGIKRDGDHVIAVSVGEDLRFFDGRARQPPPPPSPGIR